MSDQKREKAIENYWLSKLSGKLPGVFLPFADHDKAGKKGYEKGVSNVPISPALTAELHELVDHSGIALFIFFLAGLNILLYKYSGIDDLVVGTASPRKEESKDNLLFCRHKMHGDPTPKEVVMELKQMVIEAFNYSDYSFADLYGKLLTMSSETALNIFNVAFIYDKIQNHPRSLNQFELVFILSQEEKGMTLQAEYNASLYDRRIIDRFMQNWVHFFNLFIEKANRPISGIDILSPGEKQALLDINNTVRDYPASSTIQELFEKQVEKSPHQVAAVFQEHHLTYSELNARANLLAHM
ncbi:MAG: condensation domain-containing protein, partial [Acidobacteria bacterium]|nr:condensation domain-containing protein [Acidobacteriota bacterium]